MGAQLRQIRAYSGDTMTSALARIVALAVLVTVGLLLGSALHSSNAALAYGNQTVTPWYTHSWYVTSTNGTQMWNLGYSDGVWDTNHCLGSGNNSSSDKLTILDFGKAINVAGGGAYFGYGTRIFDAFSTPVQNSTIVWLTQQYVLSYYAGSGTCPQLTIAMGTSNYDICGSSPYACTAAMAGRTWGDAVSVMQGWLTGNGYTAGVNHIKADGASDIQTAAGGWSCAGDSRTWVDQFNAYNTYSARMIDYGDAYTSPGCWSIQDVYYVAWGATYSWPLPEIYDTGGYQICTWVDGFYGSCTQGFAVESSNNKVTFVGVMTECQDPDSLPYGPCTVAGHSEMAPGQAWDGLWNEQSTHPTWIQSSMPYATNIKFQNEIVRRERSWLAREESQSLASWLR